jgi:hypothetical protein
MWMIITPLRYIGFVVFGLVLAMSAWSQASPDPDSTTDHKIAQDQKHEPGPGREIGNGAGTVGLGVAKGAGNLAKGTAKGAANLVTLHPVRAGASVGTGAAIAGKGVAVGTTKGSGKIAKGIGRAFKKLF